MSTTVLEPARTASQNAPKSHDDAHHDDSRRFAAQRPAGRTGFEDLLTRITTGSQVPLPVNRPNRMLPISVSTPIRARPSRPEPNPTDSWSVTEPRAIGVLRAPVWWRASDTVEEFCDEMVMIADSMAIPPSDRELLDKFMDNIPKKYVDKMIDKGYDVILDPLDELVEGAATEERLAYTRKHVSDRHPDWAYGAHEKVVENLPPLQNGREASSRASCPGANASGRYRSGSNLEDVEEGDQASYSRYDDGTGSQFDEDVMSAMHCEPDEIEMLPDRD
ncbi:hypothetical protein BDZ89DRAFT_838136 [Hymenopellis radicata]|nr:hypothetical protein BDZ89DRAFT_838136 [Hymenopellis radicata]